MLGTIRSSVSGSMSLTHLQLRSEADDLDVEILVDRLELVAQRDEMLVAAQQTPQQRREPDDQRARGVGFGADQRRDRRQRVEQEVRVDLALQRFDLRGEQQLLLFLEPVLDARAVPDLDRRGDGQHRASTTRIIIHGRGGSR